MAGSRRYSSARRKYSYESHTQRLIFGGENCCCHFDVCMVMYVWKGGGGEARLYSFCASDICLICCYYTDNTTLLRRLGSTDFSDRGLDCFTPAKINSNGPSLGLSYYGIFMGKEGYSKTIETPFGIGLQWSGAGSSGGEKGRKENKKSSIQEIDLNAYNPLQVSEVPPT